MARTSERGLELTFHKASGQWKKVINGKAYYFGKGSGVSDRNSYQAALIRYREKLAELRVAATAWKDAPAGSAYPGASIRHVETALQNWGKSIAETQKQAKQGEHYTIRQLIDLFKIDCQRRHEITKKLPDQLTKKQQMGYSRLQGIGFELAPLLGFAGDKEMPEDERAISLLLMEYRNSQQQRMLNDDISPATFSNNIKTLRQFIGWCYDNLYLASMPRNAGVLFAKYQYAERKLALDDETIKTLWGKADDKMKTFIALGLNCGFYAIDISELKKDNLQGKYLIGKRGKTSVPYKILLWDTTKTLLEKTTSLNNEANTEGYLFLTKMGNPMVHEHTSAIKTRFDRMARQASVKASFSNLRDTAATRIEKIDSTLTSQFLRHVTNEMKKHYVDIKPEEMETAKLDKAIKKLEGQFKYLTAE